MEYSLSVLWNDLCKDEELYAPARAVIGADPPLAVAVVVALEADLQRCIDRGQTSKELPLDSKGDYFYACKAVSLLSGDDLAEGLKARATTGFDLINTVLKSNDVFLLEIPDDWGPGMVTLQATALFYTSSLLNAMLKFLGGQPYLVRAQYMIDSLRQSAAAVIKAMAIIAAENLQASAASMFGVMMKEHIPPNLEDLSSPRGGISVDGYKGALALLEALVRVAAVLPASFKMRSVLQSVALL